MLVDRSTRAPVYEITFIKVASQSEKARNEIAQMHILMRRRTTTSRVLISAAL
jgi:hypothetical protein